MTCVSAATFLVFQIFLHQILQIFQQGNELSLTFGTSYLRVYMGGIFLLGMTLLTTVFFPAIGEARKGTIVSLSRQAAQLSMILLLPRVFGINGVLHAGPIADIAAFTICLVMVTWEFRKKRND